MTRVFIVAEVHLYREGLEDVLRREPTVEVLGNAASYRVAWPFIRDLNPDALLLDASMSGSLDALAQLLSLAPTMRVVVLALSEREPDVIAWAEAGMSGYVSRDGSIEELIKTIHSVSRDEMRCSPRVAATLLKRVTALAHGDSRPDLATALTPRETEIIRLIDQGLSNKEIARKLYISLPTVKNHVHNILEKLGVHRRRDAVSVMVGAGTEFSSHR